MLTANQPAAAPARLSAEQVDQARDRLRTRPRRPPSEFDTLVDRCAEELGMSRRDYLVYLGESLCWLVVALDRELE